MDGQRFPNIPDQQGPLTTEKAIGDLDSLIQALLSSVPLAKPWQRQLRAELSRADRLIQVLRMTIALNRGAAEQAQATDGVLVAMRTAHSYILGGRADGGTKMAVQLGFSLAQRLQSMFEAKA